MTLQSLARIRTTAVVVAMSAVGVAGISSAVASQRHYPGSAERAFKNSCVKAATAGGNVSHSRAVAYCSDALSCIENHLTLRQFISHPSGAAVKRCEQAAIKKDITS